MDVLGRVAAVFLDGSVRVFTLRCQAVRKALYKHPACVNDLVVRYRAGHMCVPRMWCGTVHVCACICA